MGVSDRDLNLFEDTIRELEEALNDPPLPRYEAPTAISTLSNDLLGDTLVCLGRIYGHYNGIEGSVDHLLKGLKKLEKEEKEEDIIDRIRSIMTRATIVTAIACRHKRLWLAQKEMFSRAIETRNTEKAQLPPRKAQRAIEDESKARRILSSHQVQPRTRR
jgi:hypothetical protein